MTFPHRRSDHSGIARGKAMGIRDLRGLTLVVAIMVVIDALTTPVILLAALLFPEGYTENVMPIASQVDLATVLFKLLTFVVFGRWIYVAGRNLIEAGYHDLEFTPAARIWWFAVPVACLFKPFQGMRELWNASHGNGDYSEGSALVATWWALWLLTTFAGYLSGYMAKSPDSGVTPFWIQAVFDIPLAAVAILMIRRIAEAQARLGTGELAEVFA
ncbi:DUF4328 domain-containing protein [Sphingomonas sp. DG1-23]|uniref:DUF4328 domain-containing protein n=1 Tax=Sphingomonas sp. DG1-23 TaxID=3068316 RepID=UPI00273DAD4C|nr:DUF4328 domain-containing protein [Sphingomonas sp. DG1-23]MDP5277893.1 DUF4328 domain-containing protein [Sphingomonas sp. DG1-23]